MRSTLRNTLRQWQGVFLIATSVTAIILACNATGFLQLLEWATLDRYFRLRPPEPPDPRILLVTIDEEDINYFGRWPISDAVLADSIKNLKAARPRVIGLNLYRDLPVEPGHQKWVEVMKSTPNLISVEKRVGDRVAPPSIMKNLDQTSIADLILDADGKIRRGLISIQVEKDSVELSLGARLAVMYLESAGIKLEAINAEQEHYRLGKAIFIPFDSYDGGYINTNAGGYQILLNFRGTQKKFDSVSLRDVLDKRIPSEKIRDRIVLIGTTAQSIGELYYTPYDSTFLTTPTRTPSVVIHANLASQIISGAIDGRAFIKVFPTPLEWLHVFYGSLLGAAGTWSLLENKWLTQKSLPRLLILFSSILFANGLNLAGTYLIFLAGWWLPVIPCLVALTTSAMVTIDYHNRKLHWEAEQKYRSIFENALEGIFQTTPDGRYLSANPALAKIYGYDSPEELIATITNIQEQLYVNPNRRSEFIQMMDLEGKLVRFESQVYKKDGSIIWIVENARIVRDAHGNVLYYQGFIEDITDRKRFELEREQFTKKLFQLNQAFSQFVPYQFLELLKKNSIVDVNLGDQTQQEMSVLFADIRNFTTLSEQMTPEENFQFINSYLAYMEPAIIENNGFIDKYIGDAIMALFRGGTEDALKAAIAMLKSLNRYNLQRQQAGHVPIEIGIGINTGLMMLGTVGGKTRIDTTVISDAVNIASRLESLTKNYGVSLIISSQTFYGLREPIQYAFRFIGLVKVKGKSNMVPIFEVFEADPPDIRAGKLKTKIIFEQALCFYYQDQFHEAAQLFQTCLRQVPQDTTAHIYLKRCKQQDKEGEGMINGNF